eukprot:GHVU01074983.1.p1 GENE.GHVU01074983.1~~GHVU01074983.1.p1  ORF type:complete len:144 (+),score=5.63 GHVU01074983.1:312-743(+)
MYANECAVVSRRVCVPVHVRVTTWALLRVRLCARVYACMYVCMHACIRMSVSDRVTVCLRRWTRLCVCVCLPPPHQSEVAVYTVEGRLVFGSEPSGGGKEGAGPSRSNSLGGTSGTTESALACSVSQWTDGRVDAWMHACMHG